MSRLVRSGHGTTPGLQGHSATSLQPERSEGQIPVALPPCWNFQKRNWMRWESNRSSPHYKRRTRCVNHYTKHPHDQEVDYFNMLLYLFLGPPNIGEEPRCPSGHFGWKKLAFPRCHPDRNASPRPHRVHVLVVNG